MYMYDGIVTPNVEYRKANLEDWPSQKFLKLSWIKNSELTRNKIKLYVLFNPKNIYVRASKFGAIWLFIDIS